MLTGEKTADSPLTRVAIEAALLAGAILQKGFGTTFSIQSKSSLLNLVTEYDKASELAIIEHIKKSFPDHSFLAEESGSFSSDHSTLWVIDPLDGTMNFAHNIPLFAISIAVAIEKKIEVGVIYQPMTRELFVAEKGKGAFLNGSKIQVSSMHQLEQAVGATGFPYDMNEVRRLAIKQFNQLLSVGNPIRLLGSAAISLAYVAAGKFDIYWAANLHPWDVAAGKLLIEEAGGIITHYNGNQHTVFDNPTTIASNSRLHEQFLKKIL